MPNTNEQITRRELLQKAVDIAIPTGLGYASAEITNAPETLLSFGKIDPAYSEEGLPSVDAFIVNPADSETIPGVITIPALLALATRLEKSKKLKRRSVFKAGALVSAGMVANKSKPYMEEAVGIFSSNLPGPIHKKGEYLATNPWRAFVRASTMPTSIDRKPEGEKYQIKEDEVEILPEGYKIHKFSINKSKPKNIISPLLSEPKIIVGVSPQESTELVLPTDLTPHPSGVTVAASPTEFIEKLGEKRIIISAGAAVGSTITNAQRVTISIPPDQKQTLSQYVSPAIPYSWINNLEHQIPTEKEVKREKIITTDAGLSEFKHTEMISVNHQGEQLKYQPQFWIDSDYQLHGATELQLPEDNTLNITGTIEDQQGNRKSIVISGQWWWNILPTEIPKVIQNITKQLGVKLINAYSLDTGTQTGFYYKDSSGNLKPSSQGTIDNLQHTAAAVIVV